MQMQIAHAPPHPRLARRVLWLALTSVAIMTLASHLARESEDTTAVDILFTTCIMGIAGFPLIA